MTTVMFSYTNPVEDGVDEPAKGRLLIGLRRRIVQPNGNIRTADTFEVRLIKGKTAVELSPTEAGEAWAITERINTAQTDREYVCVLVPDSPTPVNFTDLVRVDPDSLEPDSSPAPAWYEELRDLEDRVEAIENLGFPPHTHALSDIVGLNAALGQVHEQNIASSTWNITHNLPYFPNVTVVDSAGTVVVGDITYTNSTTIQLNFSGAFSGKAYLS